MAFVRSSLKTGSAPGPTPTSPAVKVCDNGQISTDIAYATANFTESIANYEYIFIVYKRYNPNSGTIGEATLNKGIVVKVSDIINNGNTLSTWFSDYGNMNGFTRGIKCTITLTTIGAIEYGGAYNNLYCDVYAYPTGTLRYPD